MKREKNFTYTITYRETSGKVVTSNDGVKRANGYGQSWFSTEAAARKRIESELKMLNGFSFVAEIIGWTLSNREGIIEQG